MPEVAVRPRSDRSATGVRPGAGALLARQTGYALTDFWRTPVAAFFTVAFPLLWLVALLLVTGNPVVDPGTGAQLVQLFAPAAVVFAVGMACFSTMPVAVAAARERGVLKRLRGTPLPTWAYVGGRVLAAAVVSLLATAVVTAVAVLGYGLELVPGTAVASVVTLLLGIVCLSAAGLAIASVLPSAAVVQAVTPAVLVVLAFVSGMFVELQALPGWARALGSALPLEPFVSSLAGQLDPSVTGSGWNPRDLALMAAWALVLALVAVRTFSWQPRAEAAGTRARGPRATVQPRATRAPDPGRAGAGRAARRPSWPRLLLVQTRYAVRQLWRDRTSMFFAIGLPVVLLVLVSGLVEEEATTRGMPTPQYLAPALAAYGIFVTAYATLPETVALARDSGVLKRLRGTPLPFGLYVAGRVAAAILLGVLTFVVLVAVSVVGFGTGVGARTLPALVVTLLLGTGCAAAMGLALAAVLPHAKAVPAVALGTLLPLAFVSEIFVIGAQPPAWVQQVASVFPLRHLATALAHATDPATTGGGWQPVSLVVLLVWGVAGGLVARWGLVREHVG